MYSKYVKCLIYLYIYKILLICVYRLFPGNFSFFTMLLGDLILNIASLSQEDLKEQLDEYITRGSYLRGEVQHISDNIEAEIRTTTNFPRLFYFVVASSGMGKSQLASSLSAPVVYIPMASNKSIYNCFFSVSNVLLAVLKDDIAEHLDCFYENHMSANDLVGEELKTVGLLVALFKEVYGKTNEESLRLLSGDTGKLTIYYYSMSITEANDELDVFVETRNKTENLTPIFFIDEVPPIDDQNYLRCLLLRNIIRSINCICILSGTEAALMNAFDSISEGSRRQGPDIDYLRLILKLPDTNWNIFCNEPKYSELITLLSPDVCNMLKSSRPLFVQYLLDAMLEEDSKGQLTAAVLSNAKRQIVENKMKFTTLAGLFGQMAILDAAFIANTTDIIMPVEQEKHQFLQAQKQFCVGHHFGKMRVETFEGHILSLYLARDHIYTKEYDGRSVIRNKFKPDIAFEAPWNDRLLFMICIRDGLYFTSSSGISRISATYALYSLLSERRDRGLNLFGNAKQPSNTGKFLEMEAVSAAIIASHSYYSLSGCPLDVFLLSMIAELNPVQSYVTFSTVEDIPGVYRDVKVGLLSPVNSNWGGDNEGVLTLQKKSITLGACNRSRDMERNDGTFSAFINNKEMKGALEAKCYKDNVPTDELIKTIRNTELNGHLITIMIITSFGSIDLSNLRYNDATSEINAAIIKGNASEDRLVATQLQWKRLESQDDNCVNAILKPFVIMIDLNSIYFNRYEKMKSFYESNT